MHKFTIALVGAKGRLSHTHKFTASAFARELELIKRDIRFKEGRKETLLLIKQILEDYKKIEEEFRVKRWRDRVKRDRWPVDPFMAAAGDL